ncbi:MAG: hypothetical protein O7F71_12930 [Gammaproteobacteria bacterium]|nr:hypothetical protein [Gammaproteobacteria bacterium]
MKQASWTIAVSVGNLRLGVTSIKKLLGCLFLLLPLSGYASVPEDGALPTSQEETHPVSYTTKTDQELNNLLADSDSLQEGERRALFREVKLRMIRNKDQGSVISIRPEIRFGRIVRRSDGKVLRIQAGVIRIRPVPKDEQVYGVGFKQRHAQQEDAPPKTAPVLKVTDPSR